MLTDAKQGILRVDDSEWGEYLAYGPREFKKDYVPKFLFGRLEFEQKDNEFVHDQIMLTAFIKRTAADYKLPTVGGSVFIMVAKDDEIAMISGSVTEFDIESNKANVISDIKIVEGRAWCRTEEGEYKLICPFIDFPMKKGSYLM